MTEVEEERGRGRNGGGKGIGIKGRGLEECKGEVEGRDERREESDGGGIKRLTG